MALFLYRRTQPGLPGRSGDCSEAGACARRTPSGPRAQSGTVPFRLTQEILLRRRTGVDPRNGQFIAPSDGRIAIETLGAEWLAAHKHTVKPSTFDSDESAWRNRVHPMWGDRFVSSLRRTEIKARVASLRVSQSHNGFLVVSAHSRGSSTTPRKFNDCLDDDFLLRHESSKQPRSVNDVPTHVSTMS